MRVVIVGGGPAGMLAAISASKSNINNLEKVNEPSQVILLEKNEKLGKKLFISGKGRCNLTNDCDREEFFKNIVRNPKFFYSAFSEFSNEDLQKLIEDNGCKLKVERGNRVFPVSDKSYDVIDALKKALKTAGVKVKLNTEVKSIKLTTADEIFNCRGECLQNPNRRGELREPASFTITTSSNEKITADKVIIATGGLSYPSTGSTGDGYKFAEKFSINVIDQQPSLVPLNIKEVDECKNMQGLTLKNIAIKVFDVDKPKKAIYEDFGELLFTHFGVSGPVILSASCYLDETKNKVLSVDLKPALSDEQLDARLIREFEDNKNKKLKSVIESLLPSSMIDVFIDRLKIFLSSGKDANKKYSNISLSDIKVTDVDKEVRKSIAKLLKDFRFTIASKRGYEEAVVTSGGIDVKEINPKTMESKKIKGLYFAGEVIDIDAMTGGFNIQLACSTGFVAGKSVNAI